MAMTQEKTAAFGHELLHLKGLRMCLEHHAQLWYDPASPGLLFRPVLLAKQD